MLKIVTNSYRPCRGASRNPWRIGHQASEGNLKGHHQRLSCRSRLHAFASSSYANGTRHYAALIGHRYAYRSHRDVSRSTPRTSDASGRVSPAIEALLRAVIPRIFSNVSIGLTSLHKSFIFYFPAAIAWQQYASVAVDVFSRSSLPPSHWRM